MKYYLPITAILNKELQFHEIAQSSHRTSEIMLEMNETIRQKSNLFVLDVEVHITALEKKKN